MWAAVSWRRGSRIGLGRRPSTNGLGVSHSPRRGVRRNETIGGPRHRHVEQPALLLGPPPCSPTVRNEVRLHPGEHDGVPSRPFEPWKVNTSTPPGLPSSNGSSGHPRPGSRHRRRAGFAEEVERGASRRCSMSVAVSSLDVSALAWASVSRFRPQLRCRPECSNLADRPGSASRRACAAMDRYAGCRRLGDNPTWASCGRAPRSPRAHESGVPVATAGRCGVPRRPRRWRPDRPPGPSRGSMRAVSAAAHVGRAARPTICGVNGGSPAGG